MIDHELIRIPTTKEPDEPQEETPRHHRRRGRGHEATGRTLAMVVQHSGIEFDPARYLADPRRLCRGCRIKAGWRVEP